MLQQQQGKQASMSPVMTHYRFPMFLVPSDVRSSYSKLAIYHSGFRNSLMLHSMPLSYGFTNLTSESAFAGGNGFTRAML